MERRALVFALLLCAAAARGLGDVNCDSQPCLNSGECVDHWHSSPSFTCNCPPGFGGLQCERPKIICAELTCENGGVCQESSNDAFCRCPYFTNGDRCEDLISGCDEVPCQNGGTCTVRQSSPSQFVPFSCECTHFFTGPRCGQPSPCREIDCHNGGTCEIFEGVGDDGDDETECDCLPGFYGDFCEVEAQETEQLDSADSGASASAVVPAIIFGVLFVVTAVVLVLHVTFTKKIAPHVPWLPFLRYRKNANQVDDCVALQTVNDANVGAHTVAIVE